MNVIVKWLGALGFLLILIMSLIIICSFAFWGAQSAKNIEGLTTAFAGAFFAYILVKIGELFTRMSLREKLNVDTIIEIEYALNDHLNRFATNRNVLKTMRGAVNDRSPAVSMMYFKTIPYDKSQLKNLKNIDYINEVFNYMVDIEKINDGLEIIQTFAQTLVQNALRGDISTEDRYSIQAAYIQNAAELSSMMDSAEKLLDAAEEDCELLIAKNQYVAEHRNKWLYLAITSFNTSHYNQKKLKKELPGIIEIIKKGREKNTNSSLKKISRTLGKKK
jgi:hypothetical protein